MADLILVPPHSVETEEAVLGSLLIDSEAILKVASFLQPENFYVVKNQWVYEAMLRLQDRREPIDLLTVSQELAKNGKLDEAGGESYIAQLTATVPTALNVEAYGRAVESLSLRRKMITAAGDIARIAYDQTLPIQQVIEKSEATIFGVSEGRGEGHMVPIRKAVSDFFERIEYLHEHRDEPLGIPSGYGDLDKLTGGLQRGDLNIIAARPGVGKCVTGDTKVIDPHTGRLIDIESLVKAQTAQLLTLGNDLKLHHAEAGGFLDDGIRPVYRVTTALGREIEATAAHPFLTMDGWKSLGLLHAGDHIAVPRVIPVFGDCNAPEHEVKVLAYLLADGCITGKCPQFTNENPRLRDDFASAALQFPGVKVRLETSNGARTPTVYVSGDASAIQQGRMAFGKRLAALMETRDLSQHELARRCNVNVAAVWNWVHGESAPERERFDQLLKVLDMHEYALAPNGLPAISERGVNSLTAWLQTQGVWGKGAASKFIPDDVFQYTREKLALFLNRLFACDGSVYISGVRASISYSTVSELLAKSVQHLLLRFGILAKLRRRQVRYKGALRPAFELQITHRESLLAFFDHIGALGKEPAIEKARAALMARPANVNLDVVPAQVWDDIAEAKGERSWRSLFAAMDMPIDGNLHVGKRGLSRQRLAQLNAQLQSDKLARLANSDVYWDRIVSIEPAGKKQVYDLHVPDTHNFIANDVVAHNTSLMLNIAYNAAHRHRQRVAIFSLEMSNEQLVQRFVAGETGIDSQRLRVADLREDEWGALTRVSMQMADTFIYLDDSPSLSPLDLRVKARRIYQEYGLDLIIVDYLQLMSGESGSRNDNRVQEISYISRSLKQIARELKVPLIAGSQLSRMVEQRSDKRPMLSDLRESGCLAGDTLITMADTGERVPIRTLAGKSDFNVLALDPLSMKMVSARVSHAFCTGVKPVCELTTRLGRTIKATANHPFRTWQDWKRLDALAPSERIALPRNMCTPSIQTMSDAELALLGHLIGDGCTLASHAVQYTTREFDLAECVTSLAGQLFGSDVKPRIHAERQWYQVYLASTRQHTHGVHNAVSDWLDALGVWNLRSYEKRVPDAVFTQPAEAIAVFLRHLWSTDGCVRMRQGKTVYPAVYFASSSERLAKDVQSLLLRLGINARVKRLPQAGKGRDQFHVLVSGKPDLTAFAERIGAVGAYKTASLAEIQSHLDACIPNTNRDVIPQEVWSTHVRPAMHKHNITHRELHERLAMAYSGMTVFSQNVSRERAMRVASAVQSPALLSLAQSDVYWDEVVSIEPAGEEEVFDLTVPGLHNFVANDIFVHNSIEQDSDIVMFIYRDELYNPDTEFKNIAEISVQKNRNGPTGKAMLFFDKRLTAFKNLAKERVEL